MMRIVYHSWSVGSILSFVVLLAMIADGRKVTNPSKVPKNAVLLSGVASLTLRGGMLTTSRRVKAVPQLECVGPPDVCKLYNVDVMRCTNEGADYDEESIQWSCKASVPDEFKLGSTDVVCEGYESSDDPYVLKGSCAVEYRLLLTDKGMHTYQGGYDGFESFNGDQHSMYNKVRSGGIPKLLFALVFATTLFIIIRGIWRAFLARDNQLPHGAGRRLGNRRGGGGGDDDNDPPPPYDFPPGYPSTNRKQYTRFAGSSSGTGRASAGSSSRGENQQQGAWQPGFWSGALTGAAAGYAANRMMNRPSITGQQTQPRTNRPRSSFTTGSQSPPSYSSGRHESTGFGGTRRR